MISQYFSIRMIASVVIGSIILLEVYLTSLHSFLLFHTIVEMVSIVIGCGIAMLAWNSRHFIGNTYIMLLGIAYFFVSGLDFFHTLTYKGMGIFVGYDANLPTQLWIGARYLQSLSLLLAPLLMYRTFKPEHLIIVYTVLFSALIIAIFGGYFPTCYVEGIGLTEFKKGSEYLIAAILLAAVGLLLRQRQAFDKNVLLLLVTSLMLTMGGELAFTTYLNVYDKANLVGHFFKLIAFYFMYLAIIKTGLEKPYNLLFLNLKRSEMALQEMNERLEIQVRERTTALVTANEQLQEELLKRERIEHLIRQNLDRLASLRAIDMAIAGSLDLSLTLNTVLEHVTNRLNVDATDLLLMNRYSHELEYFAGRGFRTTAIVASRIRMGDGHAGRAALEQCMVEVPELSAEDTSFQRSELIRDEDFASYHVAPLSARGQVLGVLEAFHRTPFHPDQEWKDYLMTLAGQAGIAIDNISLFNDLQRSNRELISAYDATIDGWSRALDLRDKETEGHTQRVTAMTLKFAREMGLDDEDMVYIRRGALLHDIGKMGIPDAILLKPDKLTGSEWEIMRQHPVFAHEMLKPISYLRPSLDIPHYHHERWDGTGYPLGLKGEQIPLAARLFAVADVWDALCSDRPYRQAWSEERVLDYIRSLTGSHFDPAAVACLNRVVSVC